MSLSAYAAGAYTLGRSLLPGLLSRPERAINVNSCGLLHQLREVASRPAGVTLVAPRVCPSRAASSAAVQRSTRCWTYRTFAAMAQPQEVPISVQPDSPTSKQLQPSQQQQQRVPLQQGLSVPSSPTGGAPKPSGFKKTFYKRKLPSPPAIEFSSPEGRQIFHEALADGSMVGFFKLMEQFNTQDEPAFCGLASLAMVLNALSIDPRRTWKGTWRWFHEAMLDCCRPLDVVKQTGITLYQASCLARCNGARVELRPYGTMSLEDFRAEVEEVCRSGEEHVVVSYSRKAFLQTGDGHFSPIGGYHKGRDMVLVLDVARFKYPPHWVPLPMLYHAMSYIDPETGRPRGHMRMASNPLLDSVLLSLDVRSDGWRRADEFVRQGAPALVRELAAGGGLSGEDIVRRVVDAMPLDSLDAFLVVRSAAPLSAGATGHSSCGGSSGADAAVCPSEPPEVLAAKAQRASVMGTAAVQSEVEAVAAAAAAAASPRAAAPPPRAAVTLCGSGGKSCGSGSGGCSGGAETTAVAVTAVAAGSSTCGSVPGGSGTSSAVMAAARAVLIAQDRCIPLAQRQQLLDEMRGMPLYTLVNTHLAAKRQQGQCCGPDAAAQGSSTSSASMGQCNVPNGSTSSQASMDSTSSGRSNGGGYSYLTEKAVMALLVQPPEAWPAEGEWADPAAAAQWRALLALAGYGLVDAEASYLREQHTHIEEVLQSGDLDSTCGEHGSRLDCAAHGHGV